MGTPINDQTAIANFLDGTVLPAYDAGVTNAGAKVTGAQILAYILANGAGFSSNVEALTGNKTISSGDPAFQILDPNGGNRNVDLPATPSSDEQFFIVCDRETTSANYLQVKVTGDSSYFTRLYPGASCHFVYDSTDAMWKAIGQGWSMTRTGVNTYTTAPLSIVIGPNARSDSYGNVVIGNSAIGDGYDGVAIGARSDCSANSGVAIGPDADSQTHAVAIGKNALAGALYSTAIGYNSSAGVWGEYMMRLTAGYEVRRLFPYSMVTSNATPTRMGAQEDVNLRCVIQANTLVGFKGQLVAYESATGDSKCIKYEGAIKRDGSNNTSLVGSPTISTVVEDAGATAWSLAITADDTNEALRFDVTGEASHIIKWTTIIEITEYRV